jgi:nuclear GTP-binding protein
MVKKKRQSKRQSLHKKYKVERKVREHKRKLRKDAKSHPELRKAKKDPGIPNLYPFKEDLLRRVKEQKEINDAEKKQKKEEQKAARAAKGQSEMNELAMLAEKRNKDYEKKQNQKSKRLMKDNSKKAFVRELKKVIKGSDVIIEVLDARDPIGTRCPSIEQKIIAEDPNKKIILVLNKIDLVPKPVMEKWLKHLRQDFPCIAFKCSTQSQRKRMGMTSINTKHATEDLLQGSETLGTETLISLLKNYCRSGDMKKSITVGIIGIPNVGKSSLINSLKRTKAVGVGATPGFTKAAQQVYLDNNITLMDCPGVILDDEVEESEAALRNAIKIDQLQDPVGVIEALLKKVKKEQLMEIFHIPNFNNAVEFLSYVAQKRGKLKHGGGAEMTGAAKIVMQDWNAGKIPFYTTPPENKSIVESTIVQQWSKEFNLDEVMKMERDIVMKKLHDPAENTVFTEIQSSATGVQLSKNFLNDLNNDDDEMEDDDEDSEEDSEDEEDDEEDEEDDEDGSDDEMVDDDQPMVEEQKQQPGRKQKLATPEDFVNPRANQNRKKIMKQERKKDRKNASDDEDEQGEQMATDDYNFEVDFFGGNNNNNTNGFKF